MQGVGPDCVRPGSHPGVKTTVGSILHGAYGDYYEQLVCLKHYKKMRPGVRLVAFFASEHRREAFKVFDLSFIDEVHPASALGHVPVDRFHQYQVRDGELQAEILDGLEPDLLAKIGPDVQRKPWRELKSIDLHDPEADVSLGDVGRDLMPWCLRENGLEEASLDARRTVGFLWRYRGPTGAVSSRLQPPEARVRDEMGKLLRALIDEHGFEVIISGMRLETTDENRHRIDAKYTKAALDLPTDRVTYLKGLGWGLELEIFRRCSLCLVMPSGFSEALWMKRRAPTIMIASPPHYLAKLIYNRMPLFNVQKPRELAFQLLGSHHSRSILSRLRRERLV